MTVIRISTNAGETERRIRLLATALQDLSPFWPRVSTLVTGWLRLQFESEGGFFSAGGRWAPLSPSYALRKTMIFGPKPILQATGQMRQAFSRPERLVTPTRLTLRYDDSGPAHGPVAQYHQEGSATMPARPIVFDRLPALAELELQREGERYVADILRRF